MRVRVWFRTRIRVGFRFRVTKVVGIRNEKSEKRKISGKSHVSEKSHGFGCSCLSVSARSRGGLCSKVFLKDGFFSLSGLVLSCLESNFFYLFVLSYWMR